MVSDGKFDKVDVAAVEWYKLSNVSINTGKTIKVEVNDGVVTLSGDGVTISTSSSTDSNN